MDKRHSPADRVAVPTSFVQEVVAGCGQNITACYQCGNCTAGCPAAFAYDLQAHQIMRAIQCNLKEQVLQAESLSLCLSCSTCAQRCPNNIDVAAVMEYLRHRAAAEGHKGVPRVRKFWRSFLDTVRYCGRTYELGVMALYMLRTGRLLTDVDLAPQALKARKLALMPHGHAGAEAVGRILQRYEGKTHQQTKAQSEEASS